MKFLKTVLTSGRGCDIMRMKNVKEKQFCNDFFILSCDGGV